MDDLDVDMDADAHDAEGRRDEWTTSEGADADATMALAALPVSSLPQPLLPSIRSSTGWTSGVPSSCPRLDVDIECNTSGRVESSGLHCTALRCTAVGPIPL